MKEMHEIHQEVFDYLDKEYYQKNTNKNFFTLRKSDSNGRLSRGYWFHGNENYLAISFWAGTSWKNRTPNINFLIFPDGATKLEIDTRDSKDKHYFILEYVYYQEILTGLKELKANKFTKEYPGRNFMKSLIEFVECGDKIKLDIAIENSTLKMGTSDNKIGFLDKKFFEYRYEEVKRRIRNEKLDTILLDEYEIAGFTIENFLGIEKVVIEDIPKKSKWVFITGENGSGKTSILKALALGTVERCKEHEIHIVKATTNPQISVNYREVETGLIEDIVTNKDTLEGMRTFSPVAFASYGPIRLTTTEKVTHRLDGKDSSTYSLFNYDGKLLDIEAEVKRWKLKQVDAFHEQVIKNRLETIKETLVESIPGLGDIEWRHREGGRIVPTKYFEADDEGNVYAAEGVTFDQLPSGIRSLIAMIGDIIVRLFKAQMMQDDVRSLQGIVIIDEIDLHLHPRYQKVLVEVLSSNFRNIQFVVSTHSPIPLLGAPTNSTFIKVERNWEAGISARRLKKLEKEIKYLLPNTILTSDIFDFDLFENKSENDLEKIRFEDDYDDIELNKRVDERLKNIDKSVFPDKLFE